MGASFVERLDEGSVGSSGAMPNASVAGIKQVLSKGLWNTPSLLGLRTGRARTTKPRRSTSTSR